MYAKNLMYDKEAHLFYRDGKYIYPKHKTAAGKKDFWARGDGWVLAALARCMDELPADYAHMDELDYLKPGGKAVEWKRYAAMTLEERLKAYKKEVLKR